MRERKLYSLHHRPGKYGGFWYVQWRDNSTGRWMMAKSTKKTTREEAVAFCEGLLNAGIMPGGEYEWIAIPKAAIAKSLSISGGA